MFTVFSVSDSFSSSSSFLNAKLLNPNHIDLKPSGHFSDRIYYLKQKHIDDTHDLKFNQSQIDLHRNPLCNNNHRKYLWGMTAKIYKYIQTSAATTKTISSTNESIDAHD